MSASAVRWLACLCLGWLMTPAHAQAESLWQSAPFAAYWFQGQAEVSRYKLEQHRYGEMRTGHAVLVFVTEDFLPKKQVKADSANRAQTGAIPVLKLNHLRKFVTGIYDYANMTSVFTPLNVQRHPQTLKTTTSIQEWCGQTWLQANWREQEYQVQGHSYFEREADEVYPLPKAVFEDELLNRIRLGQIQEGPVQLIVAGQDARMLHQAWRVQPAQITLQRQAKQTVLTVRYLQSARKLVVVYESAFPHGILSVTVTAGEQLLSRLTRTEVVRSAYWGQNRNADEALRDKLQLPKL